MEDLIYVYRGKGRNWKENLHTVVASGDYAFYL